MTVEQKKALRDIVSSDPEMLHGMPCFTGFRVPMKTLFDFLESGDSVDDFLAVYPKIPREQVIALLQWSRDLVIEQLSCESS